MPLSAAELPRIRSELEALIGDMKSQGHVDEQNVSLLDDLAGKDPQGQVSIALSDENYFRKWGQHYREYCPCYPKASTGS